MKLTPQSMALWSAASDSESSTGPHALPMAHAPKLISEIFQGVRPNDRYFMDSLLMMLSDFHRGDAETRRKTEEPESHSPLVPRATRGNRDACSSLGPSPRLSVSAVKPFSSVFSHATCRQRDFDA